MGGGIIPVTIHKKKVLMLFGQESSNNKWGDFGGGRENNETHFETAIREGCEELNGFLGCKNSLKNLVRKNMLMKVHHNGYTTYLFYIPYDKYLPEYFNNNFKLMKERFPKLIDKHGMFEKKQIKWFNFQELKKNKKHFRSFYKGVLNKVLTHESIINKTLLS
jgi:hypothetical protein